MIEHQNLEHPGEALRFKMKIVEFTRANLERQAKEAHQIELNMNKHNILNRHGEWGQNLSQKLVLEDKISDTGKRTGAGQVGPGLGEGKMDMMKKKVIPKL